MSDAEDDIEARGKDEEASVDNFSSGRNSSSRLSPAMASISVKSSDHDTVSSNSPAPLTPIPIPRSDGLIDWSATRIERNNQVRDSDLLHETPAAERYLKCYFTLFHHRWPIVHQPGYDDSAKGPVVDILISSMIMMGAWLEGTTEARRYAMTIHSKVMTQCFSDMVSFTVLLAVAFFPA